jgi:hypothetical protein
VSPFNSYAGYVPTTLITDYAAIDLDPADFHWQQYGDRRLESAMDIYTPSVQDVVNGTLSVALTFTGSSALWSDGSPEQLDAVDCSSEELCMRPTYAVNTCLRSALDLTSSHR